MMPIFKKNRNRGIQLSGNAQAARDNFMRKIRDGEYKTEPLKCLCGSDNDTLLANKDRYDIDINTVICRSCGLIRSSPYYDKKTLSAFYNNEFNAIYRENIECNASYFKKQILRGNLICEDIANFIDTFEGKNVFEVGCSSGGILFSFKLEGADVHGVDLNRGYIDYGKKQGIDLRYGSVSELKDLPQADLLILNHVLEHIVSPVDFLNEIRSVLKDGALLYIKVPTIEAIKVDYKSDMFLYFQNAHVFHYSQKTLSALLAAVGFSVIHSEDSGMLIARKNGTVPVVKFSVIPKEYERTVQLLNDFEKRKRFDIFDVARKFVKCITPYGFIIAYNKIK